MDNAAFVAIYVPLVVFSAMAFWLYGRHVLWPAYKNDRLSVREHGITIGMVSAFGADTLENLYYGVGRASHSLYEFLAWSVPHVMGLKLVILVGALFAISGYYQAAHDRGVMWLLIAAAFVLWFWTFVGLRVFW